ncbi:MAG: hypothetical protein KF901_33160 [Myxococcales bacterium]|nr:hypothetical protein [Myxococcales bacterium]
MIGGMSALVDPEEGVAILDAQNAVVALDLADGRERWRSERCEGGVILVCTMDGVAWANFHGAGSRALSLRTGDIVASTECSMTRNGQMDVAGRYHDWFGYGYEIIDLAAGGELLLSTEKLRTEDGRSPRPAGARPIPTTDGRLICRETRFVHELSVDDPTNLRCLYRTTNSIIISVAVAHERLYVLDDEGTLVVLAA